MYEQERLEIHPRLSSAVAHMTNHILSAQPIFRERRGVRSRTQSERMAIFGLRRAVHLLRLTDERGFLPHFEEGSMVYVVGRATDCAREYMQRELGIDVYAFQEPPFLRRIMDDESWARVADLFAEEMCSDVADGGELVAIEREAQV